MAAWDQLPDEPAKWFARFGVYRGLGPARTIDRAWRACQEKLADTSEASVAMANGQRQVKASRHWFVKSKLFRWVERATEWDRYVRQQADAAAEDAAKRTAARVTADEWDIYNAGMEKLKQFIKLPLVRSTSTSEERSPDGTLIVKNITIEPLPGATVAALASFIPAVIRVGRQAAGMEDVDRVSSVTPDQISTMTEAELRELHDLLSATVDRRTARPRLKVVGNGDEEM